MRVFIEKLKWNLACSPVAACPPDDFPFNFKTAKTRMRTIKIYFVGLMSKSIKKNSTKPKGFSGNPRKKSILDKIAYILLTLSGIILVKGFVRAEIDQLFYVAFVTVFLLCSGLILKNIKNVDN